MTSFGVVAGFKATVAAPAASIAATILRAVSPVPKAFLCPPPVVSPPPPPPPPPPAGVRAQAADAAGVLLETATTVGTRASRGWAGSLERAPVLVLAAADGRVLHQQQGLLWLLWFLRAACRASVPRIVVPAVAVLP